MPRFEQPGFAYSYDVDDEIAAMRTWRDTRQGRAIPDKAPGRMLLASWNIANLGDQAQPRDDKDCRLIAELISWFDLVAIQEVKENLSDWERVRAYLPHGWDAVFSDQGGNDERMLYAFDTARVTRLELAGEIAIPPGDHRYIKLPGIEQKFLGFDRNPYAVAFQSGGWVVTMVNAHLYFGSSSKRSLNRRALETYALGRWADLRRKRGWAFSPNVVAIGDMNMPKAEMGDAVFDALTKRGLHIPPHQSRIGTTITEGKQYDQLAFFPGGAGVAFVSDGVFDFDGAIFADLWDSRTPSEFAAFMRYHISDHRPIWAEFITG
ncbi:endonuclease/exonuclease/phosphatase family protein [Vannielia sp.]|uniref:endonuclease/exonuclease/phosphatase family protein n=1 Tax=Vannielia sp. TaxID=2813045 RepID=UPI00260693D2|nr:endonuclease/exonuclease/phosphatase family protein [Vannielia sp.]MDF1874065.1 endonuclease/exonuclease/phosphatase family protein [Vannielia sp.]